MNKNFYNKLFNVIKNLICSLVSLIQFSAINDNSQPNSQINQTHKDFIDDSETEEKENFFINDKNNNIILYNSEFSHINNKNSKYIYIQNNNTSQYSTIFNLKFIYKTFFLWLFIYFFLILMTLGFIYWI